MSSFGVLSRPRYLMIVNSQLRNFATHPSDLVPNMVTKGPALSPADPRVAKAAVLWNLMFFKKKEISFSSFFKEKKISFSSFFED